MEAPDRNYIHCEALLFEMAWRIPSFQSSARAWYNLAVRAMAIPYEPGQGVLNEDQGPVILGATLTVTIAALITIATRLYVRLYMIRNVGWDDYVMIFAMLLVSHSVSI